MTYNEVYQLIASTDEKGGNVVITTKAQGKQYRQNIYISSANRLKIRGANSKVAGYNVTEDMAQKWESLRLVKKRTKKQ